MTARHDLDRRLDDFLRDGPTELPVESFEAVRDRTERTRQRVVFGPWRLPDMNKLVPLGLGAAAVVVAFVVGAQVLAPAAPSGPGGAPSPSPVPSPSPSPDTPPLTQTFTSTQHGISLSYPEGWIARAATEPWTDRPGVPQFDHPGYDVLYDPVPDSNLFLWITSRRIGDSTPEDWVAATLAAWECPATGPIAVDGATGLISDACPIVVVTSDGRGYEIGLYTPSTGERQPDPAYDRAWFEEVLATVQLQPEDAVDVPPPLTQTFTSAMNGFSMSYPEGWTAQAATEPWTDRPGVPQYLHPGIDMLYPPAIDELFLAIYSQPIGDSTPEEWVAAKMAGWGCSTTEPIAVDGASGLIGADCRFAFVTTAGRGYGIQVYDSGDDFSQDPSAPYDRAWFDEVLATVQLQPEDAVDAAPSASP